MPNTWVAQITLQAAPLPPLAEPHLGSSANKAAINQGSLSRYVIGIGARQVGNASRHILRRLRPAKSNAPDELLVIRADFGSCNLSHSLSISTYLPVPTTLGQ